MKQEEEEEEEEERTGPGQLYLNLTQSAMVLREYFQWRAERCKSFAVDHVRASCAVDIGASFID